MLYEIHEVLQMLKEDPKRVFESVGEDIPDVKRYLGLVETTVSSRKILGWSKTIETRVSKVFYFSPLDNFKFEDVTPYKMSELQLIVFSNLDTDYEWIATDSNGISCIYENKPSKRMHGSWDANGGDYRSLKIIDHLCDFSSPEDSKPHYLPDIIARGQK